MELKDFISKTFSEIIEGVNTARAANKEEGEGIASNQRYKIDNVPAGLMQDFGGQLYTIVEFDLAVTATSKLEGKAGLDVLSFKVGGSAGTEDQTVSRVKFSIPMRFNVY